MGLTAFLAISFWLVSVDFKTVVGGFGWFCNKSVVLSAFSLFQVVPCFCMYKPPFVFLFSYSLFWLHFNQS